MANYDASLLMRKATRAIPALVDQGEFASFLEGQLQTEKLEAAAKASGYPLHLNRRVGYDHSYYIIASFLEDRLRFHARYLIA